MTTLLFLSTLSLRRATLAAEALYLMGRISIHALLAESDFYNATSNPANKLFLSTLSLRRATYLCMYVHNLAHISIHALLAESDAAALFVRRSPPYFYPRSPCGERLPVCGQYPHVWPISIHALLAESDSFSAQNASATSQFLSTLSLRRATGVYYGGRPQHSIDFYPRSPCGERLFRVAVFQHTVVISIHALLAESDPGAKSRTPERYYFYPRSPCGERHQPQKRHLPAGYFYPRSPCGERLTAPLTNNVQPHFYPRSPCGERPTLPRKAVTTRGFLSTLSLRRATTYTRTQSASRVISIHALLAESDDFRCPIKRAIANFYPRSPCGERHIITRTGNNTINFYPRSPCGERRQPHFRNSCRLVISIHALLAESDHSGGPWQAECTISIHALLAESDVTGSDSQKLILHFYPRSPCGERPKVNCTRALIFRFLSTLSLRRATGNLHSFYTSRE